MPNIPEYGCTRCDKDKDREQLTVKKIMFTDMGEGARTLRSRVVDWLCDDCLLEDPDYLREKISGPIFVRKHYV